MPFGSAAAAFIVMRVSAVLGAHPRFLYYIRILSSRLRLADLGRSGRRTPHSPTRTPREWAGQPTPFLKFDVANLNISEIMPLLNLHKNVGLGLLGARFGKCYNIMSMEFIIHGCVSLGV